jgi:putative oxidoreductase
MMDPASDGAIWLLARVLLVCMFPFSAADKVLHWNAALKQANSSFLPGGAALLVMAMIVEVAAPICIVIGWHARAGAWVLMAFCVVTALLYHPFWTEGDFWSPGDSVARAHFWDFTKNLGLAGGLLLVALGAGFAGVSP